MDAQVFEMVADVKEQVNVVSLREEGCFLPDRWLIISQLILFVLTSELL